MKQFLRRAGVGLGFLLGVMALQTPGRLLARPADEQQLIQRDCPLMTVDDHLSHPVRSPLAQFPSFNSPRLDQQVQLYARYLKTYGVPDVLIVGSSRALQGVDPVVLQEALAGQGIPLKIYNFSINGATARVVELMLRQVLLPEQLPRLILWADGSRAFNSARRDLTYTGIAASEGYQKLLRGDRPIPLLRSALSLRDVTVCSDSRSQSDLSETLLVQPLQQTGDLNLYGFQSVTARFDPGTYFRRFPRVPGRYDDNYVPFRLEGVQTQATVSIAAFARERRIPLVFISLPLSQDHLNDRTRQRAEQQFRRYMQRLANQNGFLFEDLSQQWGDRHHYFADPSHLNREGARAVALYLAASGNLPWLRWFPALRM